MCDPLTIGGLALGAAGTALAGREQQANQKRAVAARNAVTEAEMARQHGYQDEASAGFDKTLNRFQPETQAKALGDAVASRREALASAAAPTPTYAPTAGSAPAIVKSEVGRTAGKAARAVAADATRLAPLGGRTNLFQGNDIALNNGRQALATVGNFAHGSAALLPGELQAAEINAYKKPGMLPKILQLAGAAAGLGGALGAGPSWGSLFGNGTGLTTPVAEPAAGSWASYF